MEWSIFALYTLFFPAQHKIPRSFAVRMAAVLLNWNVLSKYLMSHFSIKEHSVLLVDGILEEVAEL